MQVERLIEIINGDFYTGVPDSQLKALCNCLIEKYGIDAQHHIIAANEGNCAAIAAGYHLATGKVPVVYMQNSGEGNIVNPVASLLNDKVYAIPVVFIIGWRGEPGVNDEPQHVFQGEVTLKILDDLKIDYYVIGEATKEVEVEKAMASFRKKLEHGSSVAFVIRKQALKYDVKVEYSNQYSMSREAIINHVLDVSGEEPIVCTTGKASRELFEAREKRGESHKYDFLTVGSMGHSSSIALGVALNKPQKQIWCIDGDGAFLMHMGAVAVIGTTHPDNFVHILINNESHETVGGMPTVAGSIDFVAIAKACGYSYVKSVDSFDELDIELNTVKNQKQLSFIEIKSSLGARENLGRPTSTAAENKNRFMEYLMSV